MNAAWRQRRLARSLMLSLQLLSAHRLRTALSVSGLLVGVATVMVMVAVGRGAEQRVLDRVRGMGTNLLVVSATPAERIAARPQQVAVHTLLRADDAAAIAADSAHAVAAAPAVSRSMVVRYDGVNTTTMVTGTTPTGLGIRNVTAASGRLFNEDDARERRRVALLGPTVARILFPGLDPAGRTIRIGNVPFEVLGITRARGIDPVGVDLDDIVFVPFETASRRLLNIAYIHAIYVQARSLDDLVALEADVRAILQRRHAPRSGLLAAFAVQNQAVLVATERGAARAMRQLIVGTSVAALGAGAIGILAVMLISVRERRREIGLRRALGARRRDIELQFVLESAMLATGGGVAGVLIGVLAAGGAALVGPWDLVLSWPAAAAGLACSVGVGLAIGVVPAARAARLEPIAALQSD